MKEEYITIVVPLYNNAKHIGKTLNSLFDQSFQTWQCIIVDDGSTDGSSSVSESIIQDDRRFTFLHRENYTDTKGANACRNIGLKNALANLVMFVDADDYLHPDCLTNRINTIVNTEVADLYIFKTAFVNDNGQITGYFHNPNKDPQDIIYSLVAHKIPWHTMSPIWSVSFLRKIGGWNEEYERLQDVELNIRALLSNPKILYADTPVDSFYRANGMSQEKKIAARMGFCRLVKDYYRLLMNHDNIAEDYKTKMAEKFQGILEGQFLNYIKNDQSNVTWEKLYLDTLTTLEIDKMDQQSIKNIFAKL